MSQKEILALAISAACDRWADCRFMAGLDSCVESQARLTRRPKSELKSYADEMDQWSRKIAIMRELHACAV